MTAAPEPSPSPPPTGPGAAEDAADRRIAEKALADYRAGKLELVSAEELKRSLGLTLEE